MLSELSTRDTIEKRETYMQMKHPGVFAIGLRVMERDKELEAFWSYCKGLRNSVNYYSIYVHGYLEPWFRELRAENKLR